MDGEPRVLREAHTRVDAAGEDDEVGVEGVPVGHLDRAHRAADAAHVAHPALGVHLDAQVREVPVDQTGGGRVELALHEPLGLLGQHHLGAAHGERAGGRDAEETAADDDGAGAGPYGFRQTQAVVHGAERVDAFGEFVPALAEQATQGGSTGFEPVARTSVSYAITEPSAQCSVRPARSMPVTRARVSRLGAGRAITSGAYRPARTSASRTRL